MMWDVQSAHLRFWVWGVLHHGDDATLRAGADMIFARLAPSLDQWAGLQAAAVMSAGNRLMIGTR